MKRLNTLFRAFILASVITGCSSRIQQPLMQPDFNNSEISSTQVSSVNISKPADFIKQDISAGMDEFYPVPKKGMKWIYEYTKVVGNGAMGKKVEISFADVNTKVVEVTIDGFTLPFARANLWNAFNWYLVGQYHNESFAWYDHGEFDNGSYVIYRECAPHSCGGFKVEIPSGKYIVEKIMIQENKDPSLPYNGHNDLSWQNSHFWINKKLGLVEMKLETPEQPELGTTTFSLISTNIK